MGKNKLPEYFMKSVKLNDLVGEKKVGIKYPSSFQFGKLIKSEFQGREDFHLVFENLVDEKKCIQTILLKEENLKYIKKESREILLCSKNDFCPIWTHYKDRNDKEYFELEKNLNKK
jgi:hypothetical protein